MILIPGTLRLRLHVRQVSSQARAVIEEVKKEGRNAYTHFLYTMPWTPSANGYQSQHVKPLCDMFTLTPV